MTVKAPVKVLALCSVNVPDPPLIRLLALPPLPTAPAMVKSPVPKKLGVRAWPLSDRENVLAKVIEPGPML